MSATPRSTRQRQQQEQQQQASHHTSDEDAVGKKKWTPKEDALIRRARENGETKWSVIAADVPGRCGKQCRERWQNHLDPSLAKSAWTDAEDRELATMQRLHGNCWTKISLSLPGRSENEVKNRWYSAVLRNKITKGFLRSTSSSSSSSSQAAALDVPTPPSSQQSATNEKKPSKRARLSHDDDDDDSRHTSAASSPASATASAATVDTTAASAAVVSSAVEPDASGVIAVDHPQLSAEERYLVAVAEKFLAEAVVEMNAFSAPSVFEVSDGFFLKSDDHHEQELQQLSDLEDQLSDSSGASWFGKFI